MAIDLQKVTEVEAAELDEETKKVHIWLSNINICNRFKKLMNLKTGQKMRRLLKPKLYTLVESADSAQTSYNSRLDTLYNNIFNGAHSVDVESDIAGLIASAKCLILHMQTVWSNTKLGDKAPVLALRAFHICRYEENRLKKNIEDFNHLYGHLKVIEDVAVAAGYV